MPVGDLLTLDTIAGPGHGVQTLRTDIFFAVQACSEAAIVNSRQRIANAPQQLGLTVEVADGQFPLRRVLDFIQRVGALLNRDSLTVSENFREFSLFHFQDFFVFVQFSLRHWVNSLLSSFV